MAKKKEGKATKEEGKRWIIKNVLLLVVFFIVSMLYSYVTAFESSPHVQFTPIDWSIPLYPPAVVIYLFVFYSFLFFALVYYAFIQRAYFNQLIISLIVIELIASIVYVIYPTIMIRPYWAPTSLSDWILWSNLLSPQYIYNWLLYDSIQLNSGPFNWMLWNVYAHDTPLNCFPSLHAAVSTMVAFGFWQEKRKYGWVSWPIAIAVIVSTWLVKQHVIVDSIFGAALALAVGYIFYKKVFTTPETPPQKSKLWQLTLILIVAEIAMILYISGTYLL
ncbi:MAG: phosphatase PAP2 family protein [Candidatus Freyarchaeum deiterrae]